jgi:hypothetical protein
MGMALSLGRETVAAIEQFQPVHCLHNCWIAAVDRISVDGRRSAHGWRVRRGKGGE